MNVATCKGYSSLFLTRFFGGPNMPSIRFVTQNPPTTFIAPKMTAIMPTRRREAVGGGGERDDRAYQHDAVDGVRRAHKRRVQQVRDAGDQLEPEERRDDEDRELGE